MNNSAGKVLYQKAALIFEELCFLMPCSETDEQSPADTVSAGIPFEGPWTGFLLLSLNPETLSLLSAAMTGEDAGVSVQLQKDALCEIANVICGNALPAIYGPEHIFQLGIPEFLEESDSLLKDTRYRTEAQARIAFDAGRAMMSLLIENGSAAE